MADIDAKRQAAVDAKEAERKCAARGRVRRAGERAIAGEEMQIHNSPSTRVSCTPLRLPQKEE